LSKEESNHEQEAVNRADGRTHRLAKGRSQKIPGSFHDDHNRGAQGGEEVQLPGFGKFYVREQKAREGKNPQTGERMHIGARKLPAFKAGKSLKESV
jgi:DNA-binding protein HU-beta